MANYATNAGALQREISKFTRKISVGTTKSFHSLIASERVLERRNFAAATMATKWPWIFLRRLRKTEILHRWAQAIHFGERTGNLVRPDFERQTQIFLEQVSQIARGGCLGEELQLELLVFGKMLKTCE